jgi:hypothetical protein
MPSINMPRRKASSRKIRETTDPDRTSDLVARLKEAIEEHVEEEETETLPKAREELSGEELDALGDRFEEAKDAAAE